MFPYQSWRYMVNQSKSRVPERSKSQKSNVRLTQSLIASYWFPQLCILFQTIYLILFKPGEKNEQQQQKFIYLSISEIIGMFFLGNCSSPAIYSQAKIDHPMSHNYHLHISVQGPAECTCSNPELQRAANVGTEDVLDGLLRHNSQLTKYLSKYRAKEEDNRRDCGTVSDGDEYMHRPNTGDIVRDYNLKILPEGGKDEQEERPQSPPSPTKEYAQISQQTSPRGAQNKPPKKGQPQNKNDKINDYIQGKLAKQSRYLSNTGFRKYFHRQCFQNYGMNNTTGVADGIVYNGYLKTHSINPHSGCNLPQKDQTYEHALIAGEPQQYQEQKPEMERRKKEGIDGEDLVQTGKLIDQSEKYHKEQDKYKHIVLKSPDKKIENGSTVNVQSMSVPHVQQQVQRSQQTQQRTTQKRHQRAESVHIDQLPSSPINQRKTVDEKQKRATVTQQKQSFIPHQKQTSNHRLVQKLSPRQNLPQQKRVENLIYLTPDQLAHLHKHRTQIIEECYRNQALHHTIENQLKPKCPMCAGRRYTHCCCQN